MLIAALLWERELGLIDKRLQAMILASLGGASALWWAGIRESGLCTQGGEACFCRRDGDGAACLFWAALMD